MKIITINIPNDYIDSIQALVDLELFQSRSDFVREAIKDFLYNEPAFNETINEKTMFDLFKDIKKHEIVPKYEE